MLLPNVYLVLKDFLLSKGYNIGPLLASGGFSDIYMVDKEFVVKITPLTVNNVGTLIREASLLKYINNCCKNIVVDYQNDFIKKIGNVVYQMVILKKYHGDLWHLLRHLSNFKDNADYCIRELEIQLQYKLNVMHELGVSHYDIKEDNVLYCWKDDRIVYVYADLGVSRVMVEKDRHVLIKDDGLNLQRMIDRVSSKLEIER